MTELRLELRNITKRYPGVMANDGISLAVMPGAIHAVLGENGAGKSTLMKIIYGAAKADEGDIFYNGEKLTVHNPAASRTLGIEMVYQHFALFESVTVVENIALAVKEPFDLVALSKRVLEVSEKYGLPINPQRHVHHLSVGERQRVEIVRCLLQNPKLLILDEPTSVLTTQAIAQLFETLRVLAREGCSILYISHKLHEVQELCDTATVLRNGRVTGTAKPKETTANELARLMVGSELPETRVVPAEREAHPSLEVNGLTAEPEDQFGVQLKDISFEVRGGEIVGIAGVSGNGQAELVALLSGERTVDDPDVIRICDQPAGHLNAASRRDLGMAFVPEERLGRGAVPILSLSHNAALTAYRRGMVKYGLLDRSKAARYAADVIAKFNVKANGTKAAAQSLSGGNLQKFIVGREFELQPKVLLVSQPTWGLDVGAAAYIRQTLVDLSRAGAAVLVISEELEELFEISDRLLVICRGEVMEFFGHDLSLSMSQTQANLEEVGLLMTGMRRSAQRQVEPEPQDADQD